MVLCLQVSVSSTGEDGKEVARMVLDHEGNPEWKCYSCDFRYVVLSFHINMFLRI